MAHYRVLMIGTEANLMQIYADCQDSSSESKAEMTFAYDYLVPYKKDYLMGKDKQAYSYFFGEECEFTKRDIKLYNEIIIERSFSECFDIRNNTSDHCISEENCKEGLDKFFENLPEDTHFFLCDGHL